MSEIRVLSFDRETGAVQSGGEELAESSTIAKGAWLWIDVSGPLNPSDVEFLRETLAISPLAIQDAGRTRHPPKLELLDNYCFLLLREIVAGVDDGEPVIGQLSLFVDAQVLVTVHARTSQNIEDITALVTRNGKHTAEGPAHLAYLICRRLIDTCEPVILSQEEDIERIEDEILEGTGDTAVEELSRLNRILRRLRRVLAYQSKVFDQLRLNVRETVVPFDKHEVNDLFENVDRLATLCQLNQELAVDLLNTHLSVVSHRLNIVMRVLTIATIMFLPLGLLAGIYGMNFNVMPELSWQYGYFTVLGLMAIIATGLMIYFKRKNWL